FFLHSGLLGGFPLCPLCLCGETTYLFTHGNGVTTSTGLVDTFSPRIPSKTDPYIVSIFARAWAAISWWTRPWLPSTHGRPRRSATGIAPAALAAANCAARKDTSGPSIGAGGSFGASGRPDGSR